MNESSIPGIDPQVPPTNAVSVYSQDAMDDFPVLKAFQQYIDAEQAKARKRVLSLGIFFGILTGAIIAVFVALLMNMTMRNQQLNDRLVEYAMKDRDRPPVVVQSTPQADNSALVASLMAKLDALQSKIGDGQQKRQEDPPAPAKATPPAAAPASQAASADAAEIERLRALLIAEREKAAVEKERRRQQELEEYRRKHYPEYYRRMEQGAPARDTRGAAKKRTAKADKDEIDELLNEFDARDGAITYFDDEDDAKTAKDAKPAEPAYSIPVDVKKPKRTWRIPTE